MIIDTFIQTANQFFEVMYPLSLTASVLVILPAIGMTIVKSIREITDSKRKRKQKRKNDELQIEPPIETSIRLDQLIEDDGELIIREQYL